MFLKSQIPCGVVAVFLAKAAQRESGKTLILYDQLVQLILICLFVIKRMPLNKILSLVLLLFLLNWVSIKLRFNLSVLNVHLFFFAITVSHPGRQLQTGTPAPPWHLLSMRRGWE